MRLKTYLQTAIRELDLVMETKSETRTGRKLAYPIWEACSASYAAFMVGGTVLAAAMTLQTGQSIAEFANSDFSDRGFGEAVNNMFCISFSLFVATFLIGYSLNGNKWAHGSWVLILCAMGVPFVPVLWPFVVVPITLGLVGSHYFNRYCRYSQTRQRDASKTSFVICRYGVLVVCGLSALIHIPPSEWHFAIIAIIWAIKYGFLIAGAILKLWREAPVSVNAA